MAQNQMHMPTDLQFESAVVVRSQLDTLLAERDSLATAVDKSCDFLVALHRRKGQGRLEFARYFSEWEQALQEYKAVSTAR